MNVAGGGQVFHRLTPIAAVQLGAPFARRTDEHDRKPRVVRHRDQRGLAVAGHAFDADSRRVHARIGLQMLERARRARGPCA